MTEQLPISVYACDELAEQFPKIKSICNKLEAQFNFQTMRANWYGDEENILRIQLFVETPKNLAFYKTEKASEKVTKHSDDVFSYDGNSEQQPTIIYYIALTNSEVTLLIEQSKLLPGLLNVKLHKVLNLIANQLTLNKI